MLAPCSSCRRHVRIDESACPFCRASIALAPRALPQPLGRLTRAALFAFGTTLAAGCGPQSEPVPPPSPPPPSPALEPVPLPEPEQALPPAPEPEPEAEPVPDPEPEEEEREATPRPRPRPRPVPPDDPGTAVPAYGAPAAAYGAPPLERPDGL